MSQWQLVKNIVNGKWQIYEEDSENQYIYYTQMSFRLSDYKKKWFVSRK